MKPTPENKMKSANQVDYQIVRNLFANTVCIDGATTDKTSARRVLAANPAAKFQTKTIQGTMYITTTNPHNGEPIMLIKDLNKAFTVKSKIEFLKKHYSGNDDILFGVVPDTEEGSQEAYRIVEDFLKNAGPEWKVGETVDGKEIELVRARITHIQDWEMPDHLKQIKAPNVWETIEQMEERTGKKCQGSEKNYLTVSVCRRYVNPINQIPGVIDSEEGWVPVDAVRINSDDTRDQ